MLALLAMALQPVATETVKAVSSSHGSTFGSGAIAAGLMAVIYALIKIIEYLISKKKNGNGVDKVAARVKLEDQQMDEIHSCFLYLTEQKIQWEYLRGDIKGIRDEYGELNRRISDLVTSQQRVVDRIGDLINSMDKLVNSRS